ncbi:MAG: hypothetical protein ACREOI_17850 [bacterium]
MLVGITSSAVAQWFEQRSGTSQILTSVHFADSLNGLIGGDANTVLWTTDGGSNWIARPTPNSAFGATGVHLLTLGITNDFVAKANES